MIKILKLEESEKMEKNAIQSENDEFQFEVNIEFLNVKIGDYIACEDFYADGFTIYNVVDNSTIEIVGTFDNEKDFKNAIENYKNKIEIERILKR